MLYQKHVFMCLNQKEAGKPCCANHQAEHFLDYAKARLQELGEHGPGRIRMNRSGCLGRCALGPSLVVYPEGVWYTYKNQADIDEIIDEHLLKGQIVTRLLMDKME